MKSIRESWMVKGIRERKARPCGRLFNSAWTWGRVLVAETWKRRELQKLRVKWGKTPRKIHFPRGTLSTIELSSWAFNLSGPCGIRISNKESCLLSWETNDSNLFWQSQVHISEISTIPSTYFNSKLFKRSSLSSYNLLPLLLN